MDSGHTKDKEEVCTALLMECVLTWSILIVKCVSFFLVVYIKKEEVPGGIFCVEQCSFLTFCYWGRIEKGTRTNTVYGW